MPYRPQNEGGGGDDERDFRPGVVRPQPPAPVTFTPPTPTVDPDRRLAMAEKHSSKLLPTRVILDLAGLDDDDRSIAVTARRMAKSYDVSPQAFFGERDPRKIVSNITGMPVTMKEALRFTDQFAPVAIASMLANIEASGPSRTVGAMAPQPVNLDPKRVGRFARILARNLEGLDLATGIGMAVTIANNGNFSAKRFAENYEQVARWAATSKEPISGEQIAQITASLSEKHKLESFEDVAAAVYGTEVLEATKKYQEIRQQFLAEGATPEEADSQARFEFQRTSEFAAADKAAPGGYFAPEAMTVSQLTPDYWGQVQDHAVRVQATQEAFQRSLLGKGLGWVGARFQNMYNATWKGMASLGTTILEVPTRLVPGQEGEDMRAALERSEAEVYWRLEQNETITRIVASHLEAGGIEVPDWTETSTEFLLNWYIDPFVATGYITTASRAGRLMAAQEAGILRTAFSKVPGIGSRTELGVFSKGIKSLTDPALSKLPTALYDRLTIMTPAQRRIWALNRTVDKIPTSSLSKRLFARLDDEVKFSREVDLLGRGAVGNRTLDSEFMQLLRRNMLTRFAGKLDSPEARQAWEEGMRAMIVDWGPEGSVAWDTVFQRLNGSNASVKRVADDIAAGKIDLDTGAGEIFLPGRGADPDWHFFTSELPSGTTRQLLGPRRAIRRGITSQRFTDSAFGRAVATLPNQNPGRIMALFGEEAPQYILQHSRRWRAYSEDEVRVWENKARAIVASGQRVETRLEALEKEITERAIAREMKKYGATDEFIDGFTKWSLEDVRKANKEMRSFGVDAAGNPIRRPLVETQLQNALLVADPVVIRAQMRDALGLGRRLRADLKRAIGSDLPEIARVLDNPAHDMAMSAKFWSKAIYDANLRFWRALTVARPGYIPRVILFDENLRFMSTTDSVMERILAQQWWGGTKHTQGLFTREFVDEEGKVFARVGLPGGYENNALAVNDIRKSELVTAVLQNADARHRALGRITWDKLDPNVAKEADHLEGWSWALNKQFAQSVPGRIGLEAIRDGKDVTGVRRALEEWVQRDQGVILWGRMGVNPQETGDWLNDLATTLIGYTKGSSSIADAALTATQADLKKVLKGIDKVDRPIVHGPTAEVLSNGDRVNIIPAVTTGMYNRFVRNPESRMNRHPFFKTMKRRAELGMYELLEGKTVTEQMKRAVDSASTEFAYQQVNKVMFDLTKQSRFTELLQFVFPFPQPFFEGFQAWAHLVHRNPKIVGRAEALYDLGLQTGFLEKDPVTGETVVPMAPVAGLAKLFAQAKGMDDKRWEDLGFRFVAPLQSFNMLTSTTVKLGPDGVVGKLVGGVPIPAPGMNPFWTAISQWAFRDSTNEAAISYLFQFGPSTQFMPRTVQTVLQAAGLISDPGIERAELAILRAYQAAGIGFNAKGDPTMSHEELVAMAHRDAEQLLVARAFSAAFSPASPRVQTITTEREAEFQEMVDNAPSFPDALDQWHKEHPELWLVPVGKTVFAGGEIIDPASGEKVTAPRLPTSRIVMEMLADPAIGPVMRRDKALAGLLLLGLDPEITEQQDWPTYAKLLADGTFRYRTGLEFLEAGEESQVWRDINEYYTTYEDPAQAALEAQGLDDDDRAATEIDLNRQRFFAALYLEHPEWVSKNLRRIDTAASPVNIGTEDHPVMVNTTFDWKAPSSTSPAPIVLERMRDLAATPGFQSFPGVIAMQQYLDLHDETRQKMDAQGYASIMQDNAEGLRDKFGREVQSIIDTAPEGFDRYLSGLLGVRVEDGKLVSSDDLQNVQAARIAAWNDVKPALRPDVAEFDTRLNTLNPYYTGFDSDEDRSQKYLELQTYQDRMWTDNKKVVRAWWASEATEREDYLASLATKPVEFYTAFDLHLMGHDLNKRDIGRWQALAAWRTEIGVRKREAILTNDTDFSAGELYERIDKQIAEWIRTDGKNGKFEKVIRDANDWTFPIRAAGLTELPGHVGAGWQALVNLIGGDPEFDYPGFQSEIERRELIGITYGTGEEKQVYAQAQDVVREFMQSWRDQYPAFDKSWRAMQTQNGGEPIIGGDSGFILPDSYFGPLGTPGYGS